jgi:hypothetical protein
VGPARRNFDSYDGKMLTVIGNQTNGDWFGQTGHAENACPREGERYRTARDRIINSEKQAGECGGCDTVKCLVVHLIAIGGDTAGHRTVDSAKRSRECGRGEVSTSGKGQNICDLCWG